jgi:hypothetical protein
MEQISDQHIGSHSSEPGKHSAQILARHLLNVYLLVQIRVD